MTHVPQKQGSLDGLCGLYSIVNGVNFLFQIRPAPGFTSDLFQQVARAVPKRLYPDVLWEGLTFEELLAIARKTARFLKSEIDFDIEVEAPFARRRFTTREQFLEAVGDRIEARYSILIVWLEWAAKDGGGAHWSVLRDFSQDRIRLVDSGGQRQIPLHRLAIRGERGTRIVPRNTIMLTLAGIGGEKVS